MKNISSCGSIPPFQLLHGYPWCLRGRHQSYTQFTAMCVCVQVRSEALWQRSFWWTRMDAIDIESGAVVGRHRPGRAWHYQWAHYRCQFGSHCDYLGVELNLGMFQRHGPWGGTGGTEEGDRRSSNSIHDICGAATMTARAGAERRMPPPHTHVTESSPPCVGRLRPGPCMTCHVRVLHAAPQAVAWPVGLRWWFVGRCGGCAG